MQTQDVIFVPAGAGEQLNILGSTHTNKVVPTQTGGAFSALEITIPPRCGPPMHTHDRDCEFFYVLEGEITFSHEGGVVVAKPGDFCFLPAGRPHAFRNDGAVDAKALVMITPGLQAHQFFREIDQQVGAAIDVPAVMALAQRNGIDFVARQAA